MGLRLGEVVAILMVRSASRIRRYALSLSRRWAALIWSSTAPRKLAHAAGFGRRRRGIVQDGADERKVEEVGEGEELGRCWAVAEVEGGSPEVVESGGPLRLHLPLPLRAPIDEERGEAESNGWPSVELVIWRRKTASLVKTEEGTRGEPLTHVRPHERVAVHTREPLPFDVKPQKCKRNQ